MSYHRRLRSAYGPAWYRAMNGVQSQPPGRWLPRSAPSLGSLGDDADTGSTLSTPTIADPTFQWQANVLTQLQAGVTTLKHAELQKWLQIAATLAIPLSAAIWRAIFRSGGRPGGDGTT